MERFVPDIYQKSIFTINYKKLYASGVRCLLFDLDNTITAFNQKKCDDKIKELFQDLTNQGMKVIIFSNSPKRRVEMFSKLLNVDYVSGARKPFPKKFLEVLKKYKFKENETAIIGDQLLTDIQGGNRAGIITILIDPATNYDPIWTKIARKREKKIKNKLRDKGLFKGRYYDEKM